MQHPDRGPERYVDERLEQVPVLPQVMLGIAALDVEGPEFANQVEFLARHDPMVALRLVRLANASRRNPDVPDVLDIGECMARIGGRALKSSFETLTVVPVFLPSRSGQRDLWLHALQTAVAARDLALAHPAVGVDSGVAYVAGLVHDLGRFLVLEHAAPELDAVDAARWDSPEALVAKESHLFGYDHSQIGALACERWRVPHRLRDVVALHHDGDLPENTDRDTQRLIRVVQLADRLSVTMMRDPGAPRERRQAQATAIREQTPALDGGMAWVPPPRLAAIACRAEAVGARMASNIMPVLTDLGFEPETEVATV